LECCKEEHRCALRDLAAAKDDVQQRDLQVSSLNQELKSLGEIKANSTQRDARIKALEDELNQLKLLLERCVCQYGGVNGV
jgi:cell shape-determining protein MreC